LRCKWRMERSAQSLSQCVLVSCTRTTDPSRDLPLAHPDGSWLRADQRWPDHGHWSTDCPTRPEAYGAMITRPMAAPAQSLGANLSPSSSGGIVGEHPHLRIYDPRPSTRPPPEVAFQTGDMPHVQQRPMAGPQTEWLAWEGNGVRSLV
jgi:hypothetical protein